MVTLSYEERQRLQYICVGAVKSAELETTFPKVMQIVWRDIGKFLAERFGAFPEKLPDGHVHEQWPEFGRKFGEWFESNRRADDVVNKASGAVERYVRDSSMG